MNLFKKAAATVALIALLSGIFSTGVSAYSTAQVDAANYLAAEEIIVNHSDDPTAYNLDQNVLRQEIAAVARGIAGLDKKTTCDNVFKDVSATTPNNWACYSVEALADAGLIALNENFRPEDNISKAEAIGMVVKAAFGDEYIYDATLGTTWQQQVVAFAVKNGVTTNFTNYDTPATRGFIFEAGASAKKLVSQEQPSDMEDIMCQLLGICPEDTTDSGTGSVTPPVVVGSGELGVSLNPGSLTSGTQIPSTGSILFAKVDFTAGNSDVAVNTVTIKSLGLAAVPTGTRIWLEKDGRRVSGQAAFTSDRTAIVSFAPAYVVRAGSTATLDLFVQLATGAGNDLQFSGEVTDSTASKNSGVFTTPILRTAAYTVTPVEFNPFGSGSVMNYNQSDDAIELGRFTLYNRNATSETRDINLQNITLRQNGDGDLLDLSDLYIERDGQKVSTEAIVSGKDVTFILNNIITSGNQGIYYVKGKVVNVQKSGGDTYNFTLNRSTDLSAIEVLNGFRTTVTITPNTAFASYLIYGADVKFARDTAVELSKNYADGTTDVTLLKGTITTKSPITLENLELGFTANSGGISTTSATHLFSVVYIKIGNTVMTWTPTSTDGGIAKFDGLSMISGTTDVRIYANLKTNIPDNSNFSFNALQGTSFTQNGIQYVQTQNVVNPNSVIGSIAGVNISIGKTGLSVARVDGLGATSIAVGSQDVLVNGVNLVVNTGNDVRISNAEYTVTASGAIGNNAFATLYIDGTAVSTKTISGVGAVSFGGFNRVVGKTPVRLDVKVSFTESFITDSTFSMALTKLDAFDTISSAQVENLPQVGAALFTMKDAKGTLSVSDNNPRPSLFLAGSSNNEIFAFRIKAENDNIGLDSLIFTGTGLSALTNLRLRTPSGTYVSANSSTSTGIVFSNMNLAKDIKLDNTVTYYLVADTITNTGANFQVTLSGGTIKGTNGKPITLIGGSITGNEHGIAENKAVVAKATNSSKNLTTSAVRFTVTASGKDSVVLSGATVNVSTNYNSSATASVKIYKNSISDTNLLGSGSVASLQSATGNASGAPTITFDANGGTNNSTDAGSTNTYIIVFDGATAGNNSPDWTVSLTDLQIETSAGFYSISKYQNLGELPITETR